MAKKRSDEKKVKKLLEAASSGNLRLLKEIAEELNQGKGIADRIKGIKDAKGASAFYLAAFYGGQKSVNTLWKIIGFSC